MKLWLLLLLSLPFSVPAAADWSVQADPVWDRCFERRWGWSGADGAYSVALGGGWTGWVFSDTFVGAVGPQGEHGADVQFINSSWSRVQRERPSFAVFSSRPLLTPRKPHWFWVHQPWLDATQRGYLFLSEFRTTPDGPPGLNFAQVGTSLATLDWRGLAPVVGAPVEVPFFRRDPHPLNFGAALLEEDGWIYVYASRDSGLTKAALLARAPAGRLGEFGRWRFFDGSGWVADVERAAVVVPEAANEFSVYAEGGEFRLLAQVGDEIRLHRSPRPEGPWSAPVVLHKVVNDARGGFSYNAKAHPELGRPLLITYNHNALPPEQVMAHAELYRPRCLRLHGDPWSRPSGGNRER